MLLLGEKYLELQYKMVMGLHIVCNLSSTKLNDIGSFLCTNLIFLCIYDDLLLDKLSFHCVFNRRECKCLQFINWNIDKCTCIWKTYMHNIHVCKYRDKNLRSCSIVILEFLVKDDFRMLSYEIWYGSHFYHQFSLRFYCKVST